MTPARHGLVTISFPQDYSILIDIIPDFFFPAGTWWLYTEEDGLVLFWNLLKKKKKYIKMRPYAVLWLAGMLIYDLHKLVTRNMSHFHIFSLMQCSAVHRNKYQIIKLMKFKFDPFPASFRPESDTVLWLRGGGREKADSG